MIRREMIADKKRTVRDDVVLASTVFRQSSENIPDLAIIAELAIKQAGISWEWTDIASVTLSPAIPPCFVRAFRKQYQNASTSDNLIYAIADVRQKLLKAKKSCFFGLVLAIEVTPKQDAITAGVIVLKRPNRIDPTQWVQEGIVRLVLNSDHPDIVQSIIDDVNQELFERQEPSLCHEDIEIVGTTKSDAISLTRFFKALYKDKLTMFVLNHGKTHSAVLVQI